MSAEAIEKLMLRAEALRPLPANGVRVMAMCGTENVSFDALADEICADAALTVEVLRVANSSAYGSGKQLIDVKDAVTRLGMAQLQGLVSALVMLSTYKTQTPLSVGLHHHSLLSAEIARSIAVQIPRANCDQAFVCGLLCEIGAMVCATIDGEGYGDLRAAANNDVPHCEQLELQRYGCTCRDFAGALLLRNGMPASFAKAIAADPAQQDLSFLGCIVMFSRWSAGTLVQTGGKIDEEKLGRQLRALAIRARFQANRDALVEICLEAGRRAVKRIQRTMA